MTRPVNYRGPAAIAAEYLAASSMELKQLRGTPSAVGLIASEDEPSLKYAKLTQARYQSAGMRFLPNFDDSVASAVETFIPRVGPMTIAMCVRNAVRLYTIFHQ